MIFFSEDSLFSDKFSTCAVVFPQIQLIQCKIVMNLYKLPGIKNFTGIFVSNPSRYWLKLRYGTKIMVRKISILVTLVRLNYSHFMQIFELSNWLTYSARTRGREAYPERRAIHLRLRAYQNSPKLKEFWYFKVKAEANLYCIAIFEFIEIEITQFNHYLVAFPSLRLPFANAGSENHAFFNAAGLLSTKSGT